jgi:hypothetical protein
MSRISPSPRSSHPAFSTDKFKESWKAAIESRWQQAEQLSALLQEIQKDHLGN